MGHAMIIKFMLYQGNLFVISLNQYKYTINKKSDHAGVWSLCNYI